MMKRIGNLILAASLAWGGTALAAPQAELHTFHCLDGCPAGAPAIDDIIVREIYTLASNDITRFADWVAYRVTPDMIGSTRTRTWSADPWLDEDETLEPDDYDGARDALGSDRGHQAPLTAFTGGDFWPDTNLLSNITPQGMNLNQGPWERIEALEKDLSRDENIAVYVVTGPLFERPMPNLPGADERHRVPSGYWKVIATPDGRAVGFLFDWETERSADICAARQPVEQIEYRSRLALFPRRTNRTFGDLSAAFNCPPAGSD